MIILKFSCTSPSCSRDISEMEGDRRQCRIVRWPHKWFLQFLNQISVHSFYCSRCHTTAYYREAWVRLCVRVFSTLIHLDADGMNTFAFKHNAMAINSWYAFQLCARIFLPSTSSYAFALFLPCMFVRIETSERVGATKAKTKRYNLYFVFG